MGFDFVLKVVCVKEYGTLQVGDTYEITSSGQLEFIGCRDKRGYGFCIKDYNYDWITKKIPFSGNYKKYYFTEKEMDEYFITSSDLFKIEKRERKIKSILDE